MADNQAGDNAKILKLASLVEILVLSPLTLTLGEVTNIIEPQFPPL